MELNCPWICRSGPLSKLPAARIHVDSGEIRVIERIKHIRPKLESQAFYDPEILAQREIQIPQAGTGLRSPAFRAGANLLPGYGAGRNGSKRGGVQVLQPPIEDNRWINHV